VDDGPRPRRPERAPAYEPPDPQAQAPQLLTDGVTDLPAPDSGIARELARSAPQLSWSELAQLTHALEEGGHVRLQYRSGSGAVTRRVIADPSLEVGMVYASCELREDERVFDPGRDPVGDGGRVIRAVLRPDPWRMTAAPRGPAGPRSGPTPGFGSCRYAR
jgi:hypothetical protein